METSTKRTLPGYLESRSELCESVHEQRGK